MFIPTTWLPYLTTLAVVAYGTRIRVDVGSNGAPALVYTPRTVTARVGDIVDFHFIDENAASSVVRGLAGAPCTPYPVKKKGFFNSGFILGDPTGVRVLSTAWNIPNSLLMQFLFGSFLPYRNNETDVCTSPLVFRHFRAMYFLSR